MTNGCFPIGHIKGNYLYFIGINNLTSLSRVFSEMDSRQQDATFRTERQLSISSANLLRTQTARGIAIVQRPPKYKAIRVPLNNRKPEIGVEWIKNHQTRRL